MTPDQAHHAATNVRDPGTAADALIALTRCHARLMTKAVEYKQLADYRANHIRAAHAAGLSWQQIAEHLGVSRSAVSRFAKEVTQ